MLERTMQKFQAEDFLKIVCCGDIQTAQPNTAPKFSDWMQRSLWENGNDSTSWRRQVVNSAVPMATPKHVLTYFDKYIGQYKPDLLYLSFGITPMFPIFEEARFIVELEALLQKIQQENIELVLWSPYPMAGGYERASTLGIKKVFEEKAKSISCNYVDVFNIFSGLELAQLFTNKVVFPNNSFNQNIGDLDRINCNEIGSYVIAKELMTNTFNLPLLQKSEGSYNVPDLDLVRKWVA